MASSANRLIIITGGGSGIGRATALLCARRGDCVAILDKNGEAAKEAADAARAEGAGGAVGLACDVSDEAQVMRSFRAEQRTVRRALRHLRQCGHRCGWTHSRDAARTMAAHSGHQSHRHFPYLQTWSKTDAGGKDFRFDRLYFFAHRFRCFGRGWLRRLQRNQGSHLFIGPLHGDRLCTVRHPCECRRSWRHGDGADVEQRFRGRSGIHAGSVVRGNSVGTIGGAGRSSTGGGLALSPRRRPT